MQQMQHVSMHAPSTLYTPRQMPFSFAKIRKHVDLKFKLVQNVPYIYIYYTFYDCIQDVYTVFLDLMRLLKVDIYNRRESMGNEIWIIVQTYYEIYVDTLFVYIWNLCCMKICSQYLTSFSLSTTICKLIIL